ncbi:MAG: hypothetical protein ABIL62_15955 [Planctomycetota bacterium]
MNEQRTIFGIPRSLTERQLWGAEPKERLMTINSLGSPWKQSGKTVSGSAESEFLKKLEQSDLKDPERSGQDEKVHGYGEAFSQDYWQKQSGF